MKLLRQHALAFCYFGGWVLYFAFFWSRAIFIDEKGNFVAGHVNIWGDWAAHFTMATAIQQRGILGLHSPFIVGGKFSYPFVADCISAILLRFTDNLFFSFLFPSFLFSIFFVWVLYIFYKAVFNSPKLAIIASLIFLLNGGVGFYYFARDIVAAPQPMEVFINPPHEYTRLDSENMKWISVIDSMIIPQRAFLLGFPLAVVALLLIWHLFFQKHDAHRRIHYIAVCGLLGILPIVHTHSFLAVFIILSFWAMADLYFTPSSKRLSRFVQWGSVAAGTSLIALPLIFYYFTGNVGNRFFLWYPGWLAKEFKMNWLLFWWKNWGVTPLVASIGALLLYKHTQYKKQAKLLPWLFLPFFVMFVAANLFLFQPFSWDNTKIFVWVSLGWSGLAAYCIGLLFAQQKKKGWQLWLKRSVGAVIFFVVIASGSIDAYRILRVSLHSYEMYSVHDLAMAQWVKAHTDSRSVWLTSDQHNHWLYNLTGRQPVMAYRGWLWTHGYKYQPVERDVLLMFSGSPNAEELLQQYEVNYVVIGPSELENFSANEEFFARRYPMIHSNETTRIYEVRQ